MSAPRRSTPASAPTCPTTPKKARCAAATSRRRARSRGPRPPGQRPFRSRDELDELYGFLRPDDKTVVYCRIGERSSHTWFVLTHLLGLPGVRNYDGSWTEWGNAVRVPVAVGEEPGEAP